MVRSKNIENGQAVVVSVSLIQAASSRPATRQSPSVVPLADSKQTNVVADQK